MFNLLLFDEINISPQLADKLMSSLIQRTESIATASPVKSSEFEVSTTLKPNVEVSSESSDFAEYNVVNAKIPRRF